MKNLPFILFLVLYGLVALYILGGIGYQETGQGNVPEAVVEFMFNFLIVLPPISGLLVLAEFIILAHNRTTRTSVIPLLILLVIWIPVFGFWALVMLLSIPDSRGIARF